MKKIKNLWLRAIAGLAVVLGLALSVNAFEKQENNLATKPVALKTVYFTLKSHSNADLQNPGNWSNALPPNMTCGGEDYICEVQYDETTYPSLTAFLLASPNRSAIIANAEAVSFKDE